MSSSDNRSSRFGYHGDEPTEGGVSSVRLPNAQGRPAVNGVPGPEERLLDISEINRNMGMHYRHQFKLPPGHPSDAPDDDIVASEPITGQITLTNAGAALVLRGKVQTTLRMECFRCLRPVDVPVSETIEEEFPLVVARSGFPQEEVQAVDEDAPAAVITGSVLNLGDLLRQSLLLGAPLQPDCGPDCPGLSEVQAYMNKQAAAEAAFDRAHAAEENEESAEEGTHQPLKGLAALLEARKRAEADEAGTSSAGL